MRCLSKCSCLQVEPSLVVYKRLLDIFCQTRKTNNHPLLVSVLAELEGRDCWPARHPHDCWFFPIAMKVCRDQHNLQLAYSLDTFLNTGRNSQLLSDFNLEQQYYVHLLTVVLENEIGYAII